MHTNILSILKSQSKRHRAGFSLQHLLLSKINPTRELDTFNMRVKHPSQVEKREKKLLHIGLYLKSPPIKIACTRESNGDPL